MKNLKTFTVDVHMVRGLTLALLHLVIGYILLAYLKPPTIDTILYIIYTSVAYGIIVGLSFKSDTIHESLLPTFVISMLLLATWIWIPATLEYVGAFMIISLPISMSVAAFKANRKLEELGIFKR